MQARNDLWQKEMEQRRDTANVWIRFVFAFVSVSFFVFIFVLVFVVIIVIARVDAWQKEGEQTLFNRGGAPLMFGLSSDRFVSLSGRFVSLSGRFVSSGGIILLIRCHQSCWLSSMFVSDWIQMFMSSLFMSSMFMSDRFLMFCDQFLCQTDSRCLCHQCLCQMDSSALDG